VFRASSRPSSGAYQLQQQPLVYRRNVVVAVLFVVVGPTGQTTTNSTVTRSDRPRTTALLPPRSYGKPEAAAAVVYLKVILQILKKKQICLKIIFPNTLFFHFDMFRLTFIGCFFLTGTYFGLRLQLLLTLRSLTLYIYGAPILDVSRSHTTTQHSR